MVDNHESWLKLVTEEPVDPALPICDPHHHFWGYPDRYYLLEDFLKDIGSGHNVTKTVFLECGWAYRQNGPDEMMPVGETEFVQGIAARGASGQHGAIAVAAGIVGLPILPLARQLNRFSRHILRQEKVISGGYGICLSTMPALIFQSII